MLTYTQKMWLGVLKRLAVAFPLSPYAELGAEAIESARIWSAELPGVPYDAVVPLYERLSKNWTSPFPPNVADFRRVWLEWDFFVESNEPDEEFGDEPIAALMPGPAPEDGPGLRTAREQFNIWKLTGAFICCDCKEANGTSPTALRTADEKFWVCAKLRCDFRQPFVEPKPRGEVAVEKPAGAVAPKPRQETPAEQLAALYGYIYHRLNEQQVMRLRLLANWAGNDFDGLKEMFPTLADLQTEWSKTQRPKA